ncbi:MAG: type I 3-dehydroquinate dehydratase [Lachnospiraceae bacterium]
MKTVIVGNSKKVEIGAGLPKICVPIVGRKEDELLAQIAQISEDSADLVEWRIDWFEEAENLQRLLEVGQKVKAVLRGFPLLVTFRTLAEGGETETTLEHYQTQYQILCQHHIADLIDVEYALGETVWSPILTCAKQNGVAVVGSSHDFDKTPDRDWIVKRLIDMEQAGMDISKIAVMPHDAGDVLTLLEATLEAREKVEVPIITMSMSKLGLISRLAGSTFGSALTFGMVGRASAPGQIESRELKKILNLWR